MGGSVASHGRSLSHSSHSVTETKTVISRLIIVQSPNPTTIPLHLFLLIVTLLPTRHHHPLAASPRLRHSPVGKTSSYHTLLSQHSRTVTAERSPTRADRRGRGPLAPKHAHSRWWMVAFALLSYLPLQRLCVDHPASVCPSLCRTPGRGST
jgi:hypothetical protein